MAFDSFSVTVTNWAKYNGERKKQNRGRPSTSKRPDPFWWFSFDHSFFDRPDALLMDAETITLWLFILCECSKSDSESVTISHQFAESRTRVPTESAKKVLTKLHKIGWLSVKRTKNKRDFGPLHNSTGQKHNITLHDITGSEGGAKAPPHRSPPDPLNQAVWKAYSDSYFRRYGVEPVRNATVNGQVAQLAKRLGGDAPSVVEFYLDQNRAYYIQACHPIGACLKDAESLRTQWVTGRQVLPIEARSAERQAANVNAFQEAGEFLRQREVENGGTK